MIRELVKKIILKDKYSSKTYIKHLRKIGVSIGKDCTIYTPSKVLIDEQYPWLISIGDNVRITQGVILLTHDFSWSVLKKYSNKELNIQEGAILGASGEINIGNNVFIGMNSIIMRNVHIGDNVIIGTGSIVTKDCESNSVYAGNPAKKIMTIDNFYKKRESKQLIEAKRLALKYYLKYKQIPPKSIFFEYFMLWENEKTVNNEKKYSFQLKLCENEQESRIYLNSKNKKFKNYNDFINWCLKE